VQNLAWYRMTFKFGGQYLQKEWRYSKSDKYLIYRDSSRVRQNKFGELCSSNLGNLDVKLHPPKAPFSEDLILAPRRCCATKFLHTLENDQVLLAHLPSGTGFPLTIFFNWGSKIGLKCTVLAARTLDPLWVASWNFAMWRAVRWT